MNKERKKEERTRKEGREEKRREGTLKLELVKPHSHKLLEGDSVYAIKDKQLLLLFIQITVS